MSDPIFTAITCLFLILVVAVPYVVAVFTGYEGPTSSADILRRSGRGALMGCVVMTANNIGRVGFKFDQWYWSTLIAVAFVVAAFTLIDVLVLRRNKRRTTI